MNLFTKNLIKSSNNEIIVNAMKWSAQDTHTHKSIRLLFTSIELFCLDDLHYMHGFFFSYIPCAITIATDCVCDLYWIFAVLFESWFLSYFCCCCSCCCRFISIWVGYSFSVSFIYLLCSIALLFEVKLNLRMFIVK